MHISFTIDDYCSIKKIIKDKYMTSIINKIQDNSFENWLKLSIFL